MNTFVGAAAYGLHPKLFGTPVSRSLPQSLDEQIKEVRKDDKLDTVEVEGLATPKDEIEEDEEESARVA